MVMITGLEVDWERDNLYIWGFQASRQILAYNAAGRIFARLESDLGRGSADMSQAMAVFRNGKLMMWRPRSRIDPDPKPGIKEPLIDIYSSDLKHAGTVESYRNVLPVIYGEGIEYTTYSQGVLSDNGKAILAYETMDNTAYYYNDDGTLSPAYVLDLGRRSPPPEAFGRNATVPFSTDFHIVNGLRESDRFVFVNTLSNSDGSVGRGDSSVFVFDRHNPGAGGFSAVRPDGKPGFYSTASLFQFNMCATTGSWVIYRHSI